MNSTLFQSARELDLLHFEKALSLLDSCQNKENRKEQNQSLKNGLPELEIHLDERFLYYLQKSRVFRGLYQFDKALNAAEKAQTCAKTEADKIQALLEQARSCYSLSRYDKAEKLLECILNQIESPNESIRSDNVRLENLSSQNRFGYSNKKQTAEAEKEDSSALKTAEEQARFLYASLLAQTGAIEEAQKEAEKLFVHTLFSTGSLSCSKTKSETTSPPGGHILNNSAAGDLVLNNSASNNLVSCSFSSEPPFAEQILSFPLIVDEACLLGDLASFAEDSKKALDWYQKALDLCDHAVPKSWRSLRKALVFNSIADEYEQAEQFDFAKKMYEQALDALKKQPDLDVFDLSGYQSEILLAYANFLANTDAFEKALALLEDCEKLLRKNPPNQKRFFESRLFYTKGLVYLYMDDDEALQNACSSLASAYDIQKDLQKQELVKPEILAKTAYYYARSLPDQANEDILRQKLLIEALDVFKAVQSKEPKFYLSTIAEIENELGSIEYRAHNSSRAGFWFSQAVLDQEAFLKRYPDDLLGYESLYVMMINEIKAKQNQDFNPVLLYEKLYKAMEQGLKKDEQLSPSVSFLISQLDFQQMDEKTRNDFSSLLEKLPDSFENLDA